MTRSTGTARLSWAAPARQPAVNTGRSPGEVEDMGAGLVRLSRARVYTPKKMALMAPTVYTGYERPRIRDLRPSCKVRMSRKLFLLWGSCHLFNAVLDCVDNTFMV